jgi:hypothetical protein
MKMVDDILSYREMCDAENKQTLQRGMNYKINPAYSLILMSQRSNAPYKDTIYSDGVTIEYEGHDVSRKSYFHRPKEEDQPRYLPTGRLTQNGFFIKTVEDAKSDLSKPEVVKVYEKIVDGVWSLKGFFELLDYKVVHDGKRNVFRYILKLTDPPDGLKEYKAQDIPHTRLVPSEIKKEVYKRDKGRCVICGSTTNLHYDHDLPYSKGGTSLTAQNVRLLCQIHNLKKSAKIE